MTRPLVLWQIGTVVVGLLGACISICAVADEPQESPPATKGLPDHADKPLVSPLAMWPNCSSPERLARVKPICVSDMLTGIDLSNRFLALLRSTKGNLETLCNVDTMIVRSLQHCVIPRPDTPEAAETAFMASQLIIMTAEAWRKQSELRRADQLYRHFFEGYSEQWLHWWHKGRYFCDWASIKRTLREWDAAKYLAGRCVAYERGMYDCDRNFLSSFVRALELQVEILEASHDTKRIAQVRAELIHYKAFTDKDCIEGVCRGSRQFDGICWRYFTEKR